MTRYDEKYQLLRVEKRLRASRSRENLARGRLHKFLRRRIYRYELLRLSEESHEKSRVCTAGERITYASSIYPHERGGGISTPRFRFYRQPGYSTCERSCLTIHKVVGRSIATRIIRLHLVMLTRWPRSTSALPDSAIRWWAQWWWWWWWLRSRRRRRLEIETNILRRLRSYGDNN